MSSGTQMPVLCAACVECMYYSGYTNLYLIYCNKELAKSGSVLKKIQSSFYFHQVQWHISILFGFI